MKKTIIGIFLAIVFAGSSANAQQEMKKAVLHPDGSVTRSESVSAPGTTVMSNDHSIARQEAVLLKDGTQEIHLTDASGKMTIISAIAGEPLQQKYRTYLQKEGIPRQSLSGANAAQDIKTATLPGTPVISKPDIKR